MNTRGEHVKLQIEYPSMSVTYLVNCANGSEGLIITQEGIIIDLKNDPSWVIMSEHNGRITQCSGFITFKNGELFFIQTNANYSERTQVLETQLRFFGDLIAKSPVVSYCQLKEKLLNKKN